MVYILFLYNNMDKISAIDEAVIYIVKTECYVLYGLKRIIK